MKSVESMRVEAASVPSARRNDGSEVLTSAPAVVGRPPDRTALATLPRSLGLLHRGNELKCAPRRDFCGQTGGELSDLPPHRGRAHPEGWIGEGTGGSAPPPPRPPPRSAPLAESAGPFPAFLGKT